jgi:DNA-directed RNA polymerase specialized sigma24 family protein
MGQREETSDLVAGGLGVKLIQRPRGIRVNGDRSDRDLLNENLEAGLEVVFERHYASIVRYLAAQPRWMDLHDEIEDVVVESFDRLRDYLLVKSLVHDSARPLWIKIATNKMPKGSVKRRRLQEKLDAMPVLDFGSARRSDLSDDLVDLSRAWSQLSEADKTWMSAALRSDLDGELQSEAASRLGVSVNNYRVRLHRIRMHLKALMGER